MTPKQLNQAMPIGVEMSSHDVVRALEGLTGKPMITGAVVHVLRTCPQIRGGKYTTYFRKWVRVAEIPEAVEAQPDYPCEVRTIEVDHMTPQGSIRRIRISLPKEPEFREI